jgi:hypothetical protein
MERRLGSCATESAQTLHSLLSNQGLQTSAHQRYLLLHACEPRDTIEVFPVNDKVILTCIIMHDSFRCVKEVGRLIRLKTRVPVEGWGSVHWRLVWRFVNALAYSARAARNSYSLCIRHASAMPQGRRFPSGL